MTDMHCDLDDISDKLEVYLHQLARSIEEPRNNDEEEVVFLLR